MIFKIFILIASIFTINTFNNAQAFDTDNEDINNELIEGFWITNKSSEGIKSIVYIFIKDDKAYGYILKDINENSKERTDINNPNMDLKDKPLKGLVYLYDIEFDEDENEWNEGKIYNPENGETYYATAVLEQGSGLNGEDILKINASKDRYGLFNNTFEWSRAKSEEIKDLKPLNDNDIRFFPDSDIYEPFSEEKDD